MHLFLLSLSQLETHRDCNFDYLQISFRPPGGPDTHYFDKLCGSSRGRLFDVPANRAKLEFRSDSGSSGRGFKLRYNAVPAARVVAEPAAAAGGGGGGGGGGS